MLLDMSLVMAFISATVRLKPYSPCADLNLQCAPIVPEPYGATPNLTASHGQEFGQDTAAARRPIEEKVAAKFAERCEETSKESNERAACDSTQFAHASKEW